MANTLLTTDLIANEAIMQFENELVLAKMIRSDVSDKFDGNVGDTINVRRAYRMDSQTDNLDVTSFATNVEDASVPIALNMTETTRFNLTALDRTLDITDERVQRVIQAAVIQLRDRVEQRIAEHYKYVYHFEGVAGTRPNTFLDLAVADAHATEYAFPSAPRHAVHSPLTGAYLADSLKALQANRSKATTAIERVEIGSYGGFDNYTSVHIPKHVPGVATGTPVINGGTQATTYALSKTTWTQTLATDGWTNSTTGILKAGDVITIAGVHSVNPVSRLSTGRLQHFTVTEDANSGASTGPADLTVSPPIIVSGPYQTVTAQPADGATITVVSKKAGDPNGTAYEQSLLFHPDFMTMASRPISIPNGTGLKTAAKTGNHMSIRVSENTDFNTLNYSHRMDVLFGLKVTAPYLAMRLTA